MSERAREPGNIARQLREVAQEKRQAKAIVEARSGRSTSFENLESCSDMYAWYLLDKGVKPLDRVMLMVKPSVEFIALTFSLFKLGATVILIDPGMGYKNLLRCVAEVKPRVLVGIPAAHAFVRLYRRYFSSLEILICCGRSFGLFGEDLSRIKREFTERFPLYRPEPENLAAIIFTTGSTGPPKGVCYEHSVFAAQLRHIKEYYGITADDVDQPAFPLFALFSTALGACAIIPDMDATKPARVDPVKFIDSLRNHGVTYSFGSPALWKVVSRYAGNHGITIPGLKKVLMAGAPVSGELIEETLKVLADDVRIYTPYGATESLPIVSIEAREIVEKTWQHTRNGAGACVGRPLPGIEIRIIRIIDGAIEALSDDVLAQPGEIGEIIVSGDVVTQSYFNNPEETKYAKIVDNGRLWHRMGDAGYLDKEGKLWFCGRKAHRVITATGTKYTIRCEAIVNTHQDIFRSALVGVPAESGWQIPVLVLEREKKSRKARRQILEEVKKLCLQSDLTADIEHFLFHRSFPVDIRHNAKIFREQLAVWAEKRITGK